MGAQQNKWNDFSISDYREQYGTGGLVTHFHHHEPTQVQEADRAKLKQLGADFDLTTVPIPVGPDTGERLPIIVRTDNELQDAKSLLDEFPAQPTSDVD